MISSVLLLLFLLACDVQAQLVITVVRISDIEANILVEGSTIGPAPSVGPRRLNLSPAASIFNTVCPNPVAPSCTLTLDDTETDCVSCNPSTSAGCSCGRWVQPTGGQTDPAAAIVPRQWDAVTPPTLGMSTGTDDYYRQTFRLVRISSNQGFMWEFNTALGPAATLEGSIMGAKLTSGFTWAAVGSSGTVHWGAGNPNAVVTGTWTIIDQVNASE
jgi:hypothetical protein